MKLASASTATDTGVPAKQTRMLPMVNPDRRRPAILYVEMILYVILSSNRLYSYKYFPP